MTNAEMFKRVFGLEVNSGCEVCRILSCKACGREGNACEYAFEDFWNQEYESDATACLSEMAGTFYRSGLNDAFVMVRKLVINESDGGFPTRQIKEMFGMDWYDTLKNLSIHDIMKKHEEYLESIKISVGDEIENDERRCVVTKIVNEHYVNVLYLDKEDSANGCVGYIDPHKYKKTGKKYPQIDEVLRLLKGGDDDASS